MTRRSTGPAPQGNTAGRRDPVPKADASSALDARRLCEVAEPLHAVVYFAPNRPKQRHRWA